MDRLVEWIRTCMGGTKGQRPAPPRVNNAERVHVDDTEERRLRHAEASRISREVMKLLTERDVCLADALEALTMVKLNALGARFGETDELPRFFQQVSTFLQSKERDLAVVALIPKLGMPKVQPRVVPMLERPEGIFNLATGVGEIMLKCRPKGFAEGLNALDSTMLTAIEALCGRERADEFDLLLAGFAAKALSGGRVQRAWMDIQNYAVEYQRKADDELLLIAARADQLVPEAIAALQDEIARRGLSRQDLQGRVVEWREQAHASREKAVEKRIMFQVAWVVLLALMGFGLTLMNRCSSR